MDRTHGNTAVAPAPGDAPIAPLGPDDVLDLTDRTGPRILRSLPPASAPTRRSDWRSHAAVLGVVVISVAILWHLVGRIAAGTLGPAMVTYSLAVSTFVLSRFLFAAAYLPTRGVGYEPSVAIVIPAFNEGAGVAQTIDACVALDYPTDRLSIVCIDDGSTDDTGDHIIAAVERHRERAVRHIGLSTNQGKRAAMAAGIRATDAEMIVFIDSDSHPAPEAVRRMVQGFRDPAVGAIAGLTHVRNAGTTSSPGCRRCATSCPSGC